MCCSWDGASQLSEEPCKLCVTWGVAPGMMLWDPDEVPASSGSIHLTGISLGQALSVYLLGIKL